LRKLAFCPISLLVARARQVTLAADIQAAPPDVVSVNGVRPSSRVSVFTPAKGLTGAKRRE
jgi:hypothetical protein